MSSTIKLICQPTCCIHVNNFDSLLLDIKEEISKPRWAGYAWRNSALAAETLESLLDCNFHIRLQRSDDDYYTFKFDKIYHSDFLEPLVNLVSAYMTDGEFVVNDEISDLSLQFFEGTLTVERRD